MEILGHPAFHALFSFGEYPAGATCKLEFAPSAVGIFEDSTQEANAKE